MITSSRRRSLGRYDEPTRRSCANSPASMRFASSTSCAASSNGTRPISLRYMRTGSADGARLPSSRSRGTAASSTTGSTTSMPRAAIPCKTASLASVGKSAAANAAPISSVVRKPLVCPRSRRSRNTSWSATIVCARERVGWVMSARPADQYTQQPSDTHRRFGAGTEPTPPPRGVDRVLETADCALAQGAAMRFECDELTEHSVVLLGLVDRVEPLQARFELGDAPRRVHLLQPRQHRCRIALVVVRCDPQRLDSELDDQVA